jgi:dTDP-4-dehydrorhamnose 3,5-epimerase
MKGVLISNLKHVKTPKGDIYGALKKTDNGFVDFGEAYFSRVRPNNIKGWKKHKRTTLNLVVVHGIVKFIIFDDRPNSLTYGQFSEYVLSPKRSNSRLTISPGLWLAFVGISKNESIVLNIIDEEHDPLESETKELNEILYQF